MADEVKQTLPKVEVVNTPKGTTPIPDPVTGLPTKKHPEPGNIGVSDNNGPVSTAQNAPGEEIKPEVAPVPKEPKVEKREPGRPSEMDPLKVKKLEEAFAFDATILEACLYAGISKQTYYNWLEKNPELVDRFEALRQTPILAAREKVVNSIKSDVDTARWYLERKQKKEFAARTEHTGPDGKDLVPLTDEQIQKLDRLANLGKQNGTPGTN